MSRQRCVHCHLCRLQTSDLSNHDHIWVMSQYRLKSLLVGISFGKRNLRLLNTLQLILYRIFHRNNFPRCIVDIRQHAIQCRRFSRSRWSRHQHHSIIFLQFILQKLNRLRIKTNLLKTHQSSLRIQKSHHDTFTSQSRHEVHSHIDLSWLSSRSNFKIKPSILRHVHHVHFDTRDKFNFGKIFLKLLVSKSHQCF